MGKSQSVTLTGLCSLDTSLLWAQLQGGIRLFYPRVLVILLDIFGEDEERNMLSVSVAFACFSKKM